MVFVVTRLFIGVSCLTVRGSWFGSLRVVCCVVFIGYCVLFVVCCSLCVVRCVLFVGCRVLFVISPSMRYTCRCLIDAC